MALDNVTLVDSDLQSPTNQSSFSGAYKKLTFYFLASSTVPDVSLHVMLVSDNPYGVTIGYVPIMLIVVAGMLVLYGVIAILHCCMKQRNAIGELVQLYERREWVCSAQERLKLILDMAPKGRYSVGKTKYTQQSCTVCLNEFKDNCEIRTLVCSHVFHSVCAESWIESRLNNSVPKCPVCNVVLPYGHLPALAPNVPADNAAGA